MIDIAWIGTRVEFRDKFGTNGLKYVDVKNNTTYHCVSEERNAIGRYFDRVEGGYIPYERSAYYSQLYDEVVNKRMKPKK